MRLSVAYLIFFMSLGFIPIAVGIFVIDQQCRASVQHHLYRSLLLMNVFDNSYAFKSPVRFPSTDDKDPRCSRNPSVRPASYRQSDPANINDISNCSSIGISNCTRWKDNLAIYFHLNVQKRLAHLWVQLVIDQAGFLTRRRVHRQRGAQMFQLPGDFCNKRY